MISSPNNTTIRRIRRLRKRNERLKQRAFIVEGHRALRVALAAGAPVEAVLHTTGAAKRHRQLLIDAADAGARVHEVAEPIIASLSSAANPPDVVAVAAMPAPVEHGPGPVLVLAGVKDPATVGSLLASAAAAGIKRAVAVRGTSDWYSSTPVRVAAGAHFVLGLADAASIEDSLRTAPGAHVVTLAEVGPPPWSVDLRGPLALVVGAPSPAGDAVAIPKATTGAEPPLAVRAAVAMFEARRQRETP